MHSESEGEKITLGALVFLPEKTLWQLLLFFSSLREG